MSFKLCFYFIAGNHSLPNATVFHLKTASLTVTVMNISLSWYAARAFCRNLGSDLSVFNGFKMEEITKEVKQNLPVNGPYRLWMGLYRKPWYLPGGNK